MILIKIKKKIIAFIFKKYYYKIFYFNKIFINITLKIVFILIFIRGLKFYQYKLQNYKSPNNNDQYSIIKN